MPSISTIKVDPGDPPPFEGKVGDRKVIWHTEHVEAVFLIGGMRSGKSSVQLVAQTDEEFIVIETSMACLRSAMAVFEVWDGGS